uniref:E3 ubiquitin-protein ligase RNF216 UBA domain-containing protein n=1 Tax=Romanomermis culicivorax TaxID=13658 RepID=A0A915I8Y2_ROMCU
MIAGGSQDLTLAELIVLFPDHDVKTIAASLQAARSNGISELQNRDNFFNFCVDFLLNASAAPSSSSSEHIDISQGQASSTSSSDSLTDSSTSSDSRPLVESRLTIDINKPGTSSSGQGHVGVVTTTTNIASQLNPTKIVDEAELDQYVAHVKDVFPNIETNWIRTCFMNKHALANIIELAVSDLASIPKEKKTEKKKNSEDNEPQTSSSTTKKTGNYFLDIHEERNLRYRRSASVLFSQEFRRVRTTSLDQVLLYFNYHYAPAVKLVRDTLKNISISEMKRMSNVKIESGLWINIPGTKQKVPEYLILNRSIRPYKKDNLIPDDLKIEIEWLNQHLDDDWSQIVQGLESASAKVGEPDADKDLDKKLLMIEARENGDLYECIICCDEYLIFEMMPCAEGHLFCCNCLRNHAKEIIYGQAKDFHLKFCKINDPPFPKSLLTSRQTLGLRYVYLSSFLPAYYCSLHLHGQQLMTLHFFPALDSPEVFSQMAKEGKIILAKGICTQTTEKYSNFLAKIIHLAKKHCSERTSTLRTLRNVKKSELYPKRELFVEFL